MDPSGTITFTREDDAVYRLDVTGVMRKADFDRAQAALGREIDRVGAVRLLVVLDRFEGWAPQDDWSDLTFYATYGDAIARIAIVGEERWRGEMLMFSADELRKGPVKYFPGEAVALARTWLRE
jgi:hypothetical protein